MCHLNRSFSSVTSDAFKRMSSPTISSARKSGYVNDNKYLRSNSLDSLSTGTPMRIQRHRSHSNNSILNQNSRSLNSPMQTPLRSNQFQSDLSVDQISRSLENLRHKYRDNENDVRASRTSSNFMFDFNKSYEHKPNYLMKIKPNNNNTNNRELASILKPRSVSPTKGIKFNAQTTEGFLTRLDQIKVVYCVTERVQNIFFYHLANLKSFFT